MEDAKAHPENGIAAWIGSEYPHFNATRGAQVSHAQGLQIADWLIENPEKTSEFWIKRIQWSDHRAYYGQGESLEKLKLHFNSLLDKLAKAEWKDVHQ